MILVPTRRRSGGLALAGLLGLGLFTGCTENDADAGAGSPSATASGSAAPSASSTASYLPVPAGVELTDPGTALSLGDSAVVAWAPRQDEVTAVELTVERIERTSFEESFEGWQVDDETAEQTPYFVRITAESLSNDLGGLTPPVYANDGGETLREPMGFDGEFAPCPGGALPKRFDRGDQADLCLVYVLAEGADLRTVAFLPTPELEPITWSGRITAYQPPTKEEEPKRR